MTSDPVRQVEKLETRITRLRTANENAIEFIAQLPSYDFCIRIRQILQKALDDDDSLES